MLNKKIRKSILIVLVIKVVLFSSAYAKSESEWQFSANAVKLIARACDRGYSDDCGLLAVIYGTGNGVVKDESKAIELLNKACDGGFEAACEFILEQTPKKR
jgi:TPR repeat protein